MPLSPARQTALVNLVRRTARAEILPRFRNLAAAEIFEKSGPEDLVTEADHAAEAMLTRGLREMFPGALVVGEEAVSRDPSIADGIARAELAFIVDPVDGTWNFARGLSTFGVIVAATRKGVPVFGLLYDPVMDDWLIADETTPARHVRPGRPARQVRVSGGGDINEMSGFIPLYLLPKEHRGAVAALYPGFRRAASLRCSCHEYRTLAQGHVDFCLAAGLQPWDHAAGVLICQQAGGYAAMLDGSPYSAARRDGILLTAPSPDAWARLRERFDMLG